METTATKTKTTVPKYKMAETLEIIRIKRESEGEDENDEFADKCPINFIQPSIFDLTRKETMKKMGKVTKEGVIQKVLQKVKFIRECDIPMPDFDTTVDDDLDKKPTKAELMTKEQGTPGCPNNLPYCRLGCVCDSVNCPDMYDEYYEKHCRDTGDPACMYGCICENPGPHLNGESRWITCRPYKYKKQRAKDDEDCGFVPIHLREQMREGRPKRKAQAPTRYRPDFSVSEKEIRAYENGNSNSSSNGYSKKTSRPRRRLCEQEDDDGSDDSDERIISDKKKSLSRRDAIECPTPPKKGRPSKAQAARNLREPSKREKKPRTLDLPEPKPKRPYRKSGVNTANGIVKNPSSSSAASEKTDGMAELPSDIPAPLGLSLHVIDIQPASRTCQGMYAVLRRTTSEIITFVSWDEGSNSRPYIQDLKYRFASSRPDQADWVDATDLLMLPNVKTEDTMWLFYSIKRNFRNWDTIMCKELHSVIQSHFLQDIIDRHRQPAIQNGVSRVVDISHLNANRREDRYYKCGPLYMYFGKKGDVYWFGIPPKIFIEKNMNSAIVSPNWLVKRKLPPKRRCFRTPNKQAEKNNQQPSSEGTVPVTPLL